MKAGGNLSSHGKCQAREVSICQMFPQRCLPSNVSAFQRKCPIYLTCIVFGCILYFFFSLCVILFTKQGQHEKEKLVLKLLAKDKKYLSEERVKFLYVYVDVQRDLIAEFKDGKKDDKCADNSTASKVNVLFILYF